MRQQEVSRTAIEREIDRRGWADRQKVAFDLNVKGCGEAIQGPYWFGRAYEEPPEFTWSGSSRKAVGGVPPFLTVGVSEWITDERGMYVGAYLWFKVRPLGGGSEVAVYSVDPIEDALWENLTFTRVSDPNELVSFDGFEFTYQKEGYYFVQVNVQCVGRLLDQFNQVTYPASVGWGLSIEPSHFNASVDVFNDIIHEDDSWYSFDLNWSSVQFIWPDGIMPLFQDHVLSFFVDAIMARGKAEVRILGGDVMFMRLADPPEEKTTVEKLTGVNILPDGGFEKQLSQQGGSPPQAGLIPASASNLALPRYLFWPDYPNWVNHQAFDGDRDNVHVFQYIGDPNTPQGSSTPSGYARILDSDPRSGSYHLRVETRPGSGALILLFPILAAPTRSHLPQLRFTNLADDGDSIEVSAWIKRISGNGTVRVSLWRVSHLDPFGGASYAGATPVEWTSFSSSYQQYTAQLPFDAGRVDEETGSAQYKGYVLQLQFVRTAQTSVFHVDDMTLAQL